MSTRRFNGLEKGMSTPLKFYPTYDFAFCGLGVSSCLLIREMKRTGQLDGRKICIFEPNLSRIKDKTLCFWSTYSSSVYVENSDIIQKSWSKVNVPDVGLQDIAPLGYHMTSSKELLDSVLREINPKDVLLISDSVIGIHQTDSGTVVKTSNRSYSVNRVFDGRPPKPQQSAVLQSFLGFRVQVKDPSFSPETMTLMDFSVPQDGHTQFVYTLHETADTALFEFTRFGVTPIQNRYARKILHQYITDKIGEYKVVGEEHGVIPMSFQPRVSDQPLSVSVIGTRAGAVKPSTGYAFERMHEHAKEICQDLGSSDVLIKRKARFNFYDRLLLDILTSKPEFGKPIFTALFKHIPVPDVFRFLHEKSTINNEAAIFMRLPWSPFILAASRDIVKIVKSLNRPLLLAVFVMTYLLFHRVEPSLANGMMFTILGIGLLVVGIPHGALDHKVIGDKGVSPLNIYFLSSYLGAMAVFGALWFISPQAALFLFLFASAWHFGKTDFTEWGIPSSPLAFFWGVSLLVMIICPHIEMVASILSSLDVLLPDLVMLHANSFAMGIMLLNTLMSMLHRSSRWLATVVLFYLCTFAPLVVGIGVYFVFQHSTTAWGHLGNRINQDTGRLWLYAAPFSLLAVALFFSFQPVSTLVTTDVVGFVVVFASCISIPHIFSMHHFYNQGSHLKQSDPKPSIDAQAHTPDEARQAVI